MQIEFDKGALLLHDAPGTIPRAEWNDHAGTYRARAYRYRALLKQAEQWSDGGDQAILDSGSSHAVEDIARVYPDPALTPTLQIEPRDYQQTALGSWGVHDRQDIVVLPTDSGKTLLGLQAIADAGANALVAAPAVNLMSQWHAAFIHAFGEQLTDEVSVLDGGCHDTGTPTVTTYDSAYHYIDEYGDRFSLLTTDGTHHLATETYL